MLAAVLLFAQTPQTVTFSHPCASAAVVLEALGKEMGVPIRPSGTVSQDYFAIKLSGVPVEEAKRVIAATLDAEWLQKETILYLDRGAKQQLKAKLEEDEGIRRSVKEFLDRNPEREIDKEAVKKALIDLNDPKRTPTSQQQAMNVLQQFNADQRLGARIVRTLGAEFFVSVEERRPKRFFLSADGSTDMSASMKGALAKYDAEQGLILEISRATGANNPFAQAEAGQTTDTAITVSRTRGNVSVTLVRRSSVGAQNVNNRSGQLATFNGRAQNGLQGRRPSIQALKGTLDLTATARSVAKVLYRDAATTEVDRSAALAVAKDLLGNELQAMIGSVPLFQMAEQGGRDFVAVLPDQTVTNCIWVRGNDLDPIWNLWLRGMAIAEDGKTKVVQIRPSDPSWGQSFRYDRVAVSRFLSDVDRNRRVTLDSLSAFAFPMSDNVEFTSNWRFASSFVPVRQEQYDFVALKTYGSLNPTQKRFAQNGGCVLPLRSLATSVRELIEDQITSQGASFSSQSPGVTWNANGRSNRGNTTYGPLSIMGQVPPNCEVKVVVYKNSLLRPAPGTRNSGNNQLLTPDQIADALRQRPNQGDPDFKNATVANVERLQVEVFAPGTGYMHFAAQVDDTTTATKFVPLANLPEPWRSQIAAAVSRRGG